MTMRSSFVTIFLIFSFSFCNGASNAIRVNRFHKDSICNIQERISKCCSKPLPQMASFIQCVAKCARDHLCIGASLDEHGVCFNHELCVLSTPIAPCVDHDKHTNYRYKYCTHGKWDSSTGRCVCEYGNTGTRCQTCPINCGDLKFRGYPTGFFRICLNKNRDNKIAKVVCDTKEGSIYTMLNRGSLGSNRTWNEYVYGFYIDINNFWVGLDDWHKITNRFTYRLWMMLSDLESGNFEYCDYPQFKITGQGNNYSFDYYYNRRNNACKNRAVNCLHQNLRGTPFSTWDADNDGDVDQNCAGKAGVGWWYSGCQPACNLLGWGLETNDWTNAPPRERLSWPQFDMTGLFADSTVAFMILGI